MNLVTMMRTEQRIDRGRLLDLAGKPCWVLLGRGSLLDVGELCWLGMQTPTSVTFTWHHYIPCFSTLTSAHVQVVYC